MGSTEQLALLLSRAIDMFGVTGAAVVRRRTKDEPDSVIAATDGFDLSGGATTTEAVDEEHDLILTGGPVPAERKRLLAAYSAHAGAILARRALQDQAVSYTHLDVYKRQAERFAQLRQMGIRTVMITGDNPLTAAAIAKEAGVDDFLAEATPEDKMALIKAEQEGGRLVAMTGDGTNDAPALAQADVGVAMNTGTSAAKEAGNMVDLDSDPTKLIDIVGIGKQLLITRGALTTFSIANDIAKYFAIIPAMFVSTFPGLAALNVMRLHSPQSAMLSAVIFNALVIVALIPVSYTHLDVYKRQPSNRWPFTPAGACRSLCWSPSSSASSPPPSVRCCRPSASPGWTGWSNACLLYTSRCV